MLHLVSLVMTITIESYREGKNMLKAFTSILSTIVVLVVSGCTYTVIENRSIPLTIPWSGVPDENIYRPNDISSYIDGGGIGLKIQIDNYSTSYRGLKILGVEAQREPDAKIEEQDFFLLIGIHRSVDQAELIFRPWALVLEVSDLAGKNTSYLQPKMIYKTGSLTPCFLKDMVEQRTNPGDVVDATNPILVAKANKNEFDCFNVIFATRAGFDNQIMSLDLRHSLPSFKHKMIYFHPKKIDWTRSN
jgi:hypothetical protein